MLARRLLMATFAGASEVPALGSSYGGGYFAGQINDSGVIYNLIVAPKASGEASKQYKTGSSGDSPAATAQNLVYGKLATDAFDDASHPAFAWAKDLSIGGYTDWYIPAKNELEIIYRNLKPSTGSNSTSSGANANAVPSATGNYTAVAPSRTSVAAFQSGGAEAFGTISSYLTSSEYASVTGTAWTQSFSEGAQNYSAKSFTATVRAIRRVAA